MRALAGGPSPAQLEEPQSQIVIVSTFQWSPRGGEPNDRGRLGRCHPEGDKRSRLVGEERLY